MGLDSIIRARPQKRTWLRRRVMKSYGIITFSAFPSNPVSVCKGSKIYDNILR
jgi:hypothetical protein